MKTVLAEIEALEFGKLKISKQELFLEECTAPFQKTLSKDYGIDIQSTQLASQSTLEVQQDFVYQNIWQYSRASGTQHQSYVIV